MNPRLPLPALSSGTPLDTVDVRRRALITTACLATMAMTTGVAWAADGDIGPGAPLPPLAVADQFDRPVRIEAGTRFLLFAADKAAGDAATEALKAHPDLLAQQRIVYIADISGMPAVITRMFALPKWRELPFPVGLVRDAQLTAALPRKAGELTLLMLDQGKVQGVEYLTDAAAVRRRFGL